MPQGADPTRPFADPAKLVGLQIWRLFLSSGWAQGCVAMWLPEQDKHVVVYNAGTDLELAEELDLQRPQVQLSWQDPERLVPACSSVSQARAEVWSRTDVTYAQ